jgi:hypothetical protein
MSPSLAVVADNDLATKTAETLSERVRRLQAEARAMAREHVAALEQALLEVEQIAAEIASGGDAYPAGVRDIAGRLAEDLHTKAQALEAIAARN